MDATQHKLVVQAYLDMSYGVREARQKTSYQLDCVYEWQKIKQGMAKVSEIAEVRALELDGLVLTPLSDCDMLAWEVLVQAKLDEVGHRKHMGIARKAGECMGEFRGFMGEFLGFVGERANSPISAGPAWPTGGPLPPPLCLGEGGTWLIQAETISPDV